MKKFFAIGLLAICALALSQQQASAWISTCIGGSLNLGFQSGGNCVLHGLWHNGQPPAPAPQVHYHQSTHYYAPYYGAFDMPMIEPSYAQPMMQYTPSLQYATTPNPMYYYGR